MPSTKISAVVPGAGQAVTQVTVDSTSRQYFILYVKPSGANGSELPVTIVKGQDGKTSIGDGRPLREGQYRVAALSTEKPGDADGDGIDDLRELADPTLNPLNPATTVPAADGAVIINDRAAFEALSYQGDDVLRDTYLAGREFVKFWLVGTDTDRPSLYFMNTEVHRGHFSFGPIIGLAGRGPRAGTMRGDIAYNPNAVGPNGTKGVYRFAFQPGDAFSFAEIAVAYELLSSSLPAFRASLYYYPFEGPARSLYDSEKALYDGSRVAVVLEDL